MDLSGKLIREMASSLWQFGYVIAYSEECQEALVKCPSYEEPTDYHELDEMDVQPTQRFVEMSQEINEINDQNQDDSSDDDSSSWLSKSEKPSSVAIMIKQTDTPLGSSGEHEQSSYSCRRPRKTKKIKHKNKEPYPTKNFLPVFRPLIINYIEKRCPSASKNKVIIEIKAKKCINCQDFEKLFDQEEFRAILAQYFKQKQIYRDLMQSRVAYKLKLKYFERIKVFEKAFRTRKFEKIN